MNSETTQFHSKLQARLVGWPVRFEHTLAMAGLTAALAMPGLAQQPAAVSVKIPPKVMSAISLKAAPNAQCSVMPQGVEGATPLTVFANDQGTATFYVTPSQVSTSSAKLTATCSGSAQQTVEIQSVEGTLPVRAPMAKMTASVQSSLGYKTRPALTGDPQMLSNNELVQQGYPLRPDAQQSPGAYASWLKAVSQPTVVIPAKTVRQEGRFHGPVKPSGQFVESAPVSSGTATSSNWSGYVLYGPYSPFDWVEGEWYVPTTYGGETGKTVYSSVWIGLDGWGSNNVVQDGTEEDVTVWNFVFFTITSRSYYPWKEICCQEPEVTLSNFTVNPGDEIFSEVWMSDAYGNLNPYGGYGNFWFEDITTGQSTSVRTFFNSGVYTGGSAEWIAERPTVGGSLPDLADYSYALMLYPWAYTRDGSWVNYLNGGDGAASYQTTMYNGSHALSTVFPVNSNEMEFLWLNYH